MKGFSRRQLASYAVKELLAGRPAAQVAERLAAGLVVSGRRKETDLLLADIDKELEDRGMVARVRLTSATKIPDGLRQELLTQIKRAVGVKETELEEKIDAAVIGGLKIETANHVWDKTVARKLGRIKESV